MARLGFYMKPQTFATATWKDQQTFLSPGDSLQLRL